MASTRAFELLRTCLPMLGLLLLHSSVEHRAVRISRGNVSATRGEGVRRLMLVLSLAVLITLVGLRVVRS
jgi:hypothetical protein